MTDQHAWDEYHGGQRWTAPHCPDCGAEREADCCRDAEDAERYAELLRDLRRAAHEHARLRRRYGLSPRFDDALVERAIVRICGLASSVRTCRIEPSMAPWNVRTALVSSVPASAIVRSSVAKRWSSWIRCSDASRSIDAKDVVELAFMLERQIANGRETYKGMAEKLVEYQDTPDKESFLGVLELSYVS